MDAVYVKENMHISWVSETGLVDNIHNVIKEYKDSRNLQVGIAERMLPFNKEIRNML